MSKANKKAVALFSKQTNKKEFKESFENAFLSTNLVEVFFGSYKLSEKEEDQLRNLVDVRYKSEGIGKKKIGEDIVGLLELSSQIRAITKQSVLLHGERILRGQEILKRYKRGAFTAWLELTYGNRQTPYNFLYFYSLYRELPGATKTLFQKIPYRAAYLLGARNGALEDKIHVIEKFHQKSQKELLVLIEKTFPLARSGRKRGTRSNLTLMELVDVALDNLTIVCLKNGELGPKTIQKLKQIQYLLDEVLSK